MGLDRDDIVIRRRLRQKLEFVAEDMGVAEPSDGDSPPISRRTPSGSGARIV